MAFSFIKKPIEHAQARIEETSQGLKPGFLERIHQRLSTEQAEVDSVKAKLAEKEAEALALANQFSQLVAEVHRETETLQRATESLEKQMGDLQILETSMLDAWAMNPSGPDYKRIVSLRASIQDFPRVRKHLEQKIDMVQERLGAFERANQ